MWIGSMRVLFRYGYRPDSDPKHAERRSASWPPEPAGPNRTGSPTRSPYRQARPVTAQRALCESQSAVVYVVGVNGAARGREGSRPALNGSEFLRVISRSVITVRRSRRRRMIIEAIGKPEPITADAGCLSQLHDGIGRIAAGDDCFGADSPDSACRSLRARQCLRSMVGTSDA